MEKAVVRRGIGAVVLALVAALLLGYLLKGKGEDRQKVTQMDLPKAPIQIFPEGGADGTAPQGQAAVQTPGQGPGMGTVAAGAAAGAGAAIVSGAKKAGEEAANTGKKLVSTDANTGKKAAPKEADLIVDKKTGNPHMAKSNVVVDGAGQAVYGTKDPGAKSTPANFAFRTPGAKEVRPSIDGKITLNKDSKKKVAAKSTARLVNEKKLPAVGKSKSGKSSTAKKVASSRNNKSRKLGKVASTKGKASAAKAKKKSVASVGRNKYAVQLLATSSASKANSLKATLKREGYAAYVSKTRRGGKALYRVRVGSYTGRSAALKKQAAMKRRYQKNPYVQSSIVIKN